MYVLFFMVISGNMLSQLSIIETLNGSNYGSWRETIKIGFCHSSAVLHTHKNVSKWFTTFPSGLLQEQPVVVHCWRD
jgi:hypothetical protein